MEERSESTESRVVKKGRHQVGIRAWLKASDKLHVLLRNIPSPALSMGDLIRRV